LYSCCSVLFQIGHYHHVSCNYTGPGTIYMLWNIVFIWIDISSNTHVLKQSICCCEILCLFEWTSLPHVLKQASNKEREIICFNIVCLVFISIRYQQRSCPYSPARPVVMKTFLTWRRRSIWWTAGSPWDVTSPWTGRRLSVTCLHPPMSCSEVSAFCSTRTDVSSRLGPALCGGACQTEQHHKEVHTHPWYFGSSVPGLATLCLHGFCCRRWINNTEHVAKSCLEIFEELCTDWC
jgi:hypothetical protein